MSSPEDRQAAARRVAREIVGKMEEMCDAPDGSWAGELDESVTAIIAPRLAFPGGDAEPVAWRWTLRADSDPHEEPLVELCKKKPRAVGEHDTVEPLYAAPLTDEDCRGGIGTHAAVAPERP